MKFIFLALLGCLLVSAAFGKFVREENDSFIIQTDHTRLVINKPHGMLTSARVNGTQFELTSDYEDFSLFFTEFALQFPNQGLEFFSNSNRKNFNGTVEITDYYLDADFFRVKFRWSNQYIVTQWSYNIFKNQKFMFVNLDREIKTAHVYANHQQCAMANPDFDNFYIVNYENEWFQTMDRGNVGAGSAEGAANFQHTTFAAQNVGKATRFPAFGWYQSDFDLSFGIILTAVSPNQRATFSYHGGGRTEKPRHPGFSEVQFDWFGKADSESLFLKEGTKYSLQLVYYFSQGKIDSLDTFNRGLFNESHFDSEPIENYVAASWGGRHAYLPKYSWTFPQASNNFICSQELFYHRAFSIPQSQNGTAQSQLFDFFTLAQIGNDSLDLTPLPTVPAQPLLHKSASTSESADSMQGEVVWEVGPLEHTLTFQAFENSDKIKMRGEIECLQPVRLKQLWLALPFGPRVRKINRIDEFAWDFRTKDTIWEEMGITLYNLSGVQRADTSNRQLRLFLFENQADEYLTGNWKYSFTLFPHRQYQVYHPSQITPFFDLPEESYRDYYLALPSIKFEKNYGIRPDNRLTVLNAESFSDSSVFLKMRGHAEPGNYPLYFLARGKPIEAIKIDKWFISPEHWRYDPASGQVRLEYSWDGIFEIEFYQERILPYDSYHLTNIQIQQQDNRAILSWDANFTLKDALFEIYRTRGNQNPELILRSTLKENQFVDVLEVPYGEYVYEIKIFVADQEKSYGPIETHFPIQFALLSPNFPNPFNSETRFAYQINSTGRVKIQVFNLQGQLVKSLKDDLMTPEIYTLSWDGTDEFNRTVPGGLYFVRIQSGGRSQTQKVIFVP